MSKLFDVAQAALDGIVAHWPGGITEPPARRYVSNGQIIWDCCEQLAVMVERTFGHAGDITAEQFVIDRPLIGVRACTLAVWVTREAPDIDSNDAGDVIIPSAAEITANASVVLDDANAVLISLLQAHRDGELGPCMGFALENWTSEGQEGGFVGGVTRLRVSLI